MICRRSFIKYFYFLLLYTVVNYPVARNSTMYVDVPESHGRNGQFRNPTLAQFRNPRWNHHNLVTKNKFKHVNYFCSFIWNPKNETVFCFSYTKILSQLRGVSSITHKKRDRITKTISIVVVCFILSWLPSHAFRLKIILK